MCALVARRRIGHNGAIAIQIGATTGDPMRIPPLAALVLAASLAGCTYPAVPTAAPGPAPAAAQAAPAPGARAPGTFQLDIGQANLRREIELHGIACMLARFPVDAASAFSRSVQDTVGQVVERVELAAAAPASGGAGRARGRPVRPLPHPPSGDGAGAPGVLRRR